MLFNLWNVCHIIITLCHNQLKWALELFLFAKLFHIIVSSWLLCFFICLLNFISTNFLKNRQKKSGSFNKCDSIQTVHSEELLSKKCRMTRIKKDMNCDLYVFDSRFWILMKLAMCFPSGKISKWTILFLGTHFASLQNQTDTATANSFQGLSWVAEELWRWCPCVNECSISCRMFRVWAAGIVV